MDWTRSLGVRWLYAVVDPETWLDSYWLKEVTSCTATFDDETELISSASIELADELPPECYVRAYCEATQDGVTQRFAVGTWLVQTPSRSSDNTLATTSCQAYSPLLELQDVHTPLGWSAEGEVDDALEEVCSHMRAPYLPYATGATLTDGVKASKDEKWLDVMWALVDSAGIDLSIDGMGRVSPRPAVAPWAMNPSMMLDDRAERGILAAEATEEVDLYSIPNRMEVLKSDSGGFVLGVAVNDDPASPVSTVSRGRIVSQRETNPDGLMASSTQEQANELAERMLREASVLTKTWTVKMGVTPISIGDCVRFKHSLLGVDEIAVVRKVEMVMDVEAQMTLTITSTREVW